MARTQRGFLFDPNRCLGCRTCIMACATGNDLPPGVYLRNVEMQEFQKGAQVIKYYLSTSCNHCANPECFRLCPERVYRKRHDGVVIFEQTKCTGCGTCTRGCPFEAPVVNPATGKVIKCDLCYEKLDEGETPFCVAACPVKALSLIDISNTNSRTPDLVRRLPGVVKIQLTRPSIRYLALKIGKQILRHPRRKEDVYENEDEL
ncbi:MAG: 4Fe-4S dicluster domain-containing protein [Desulfitobacterium sp.]